MRSNNLLQRVVSTSFILVAPLAAPQCGSADILFEQVVCDLGQVGVGRGICPIFDLGMARVT